LAVREAPLYVAVIVALDCEDVVEVLTRKLIADCPAGTVTDEGTCTSPLLLLASVTTAPPAGAPEESVTVPVGCDWLVTAD
jgi:hypothetical protein